MDEDRKGSMMAEEIDKNKKETWWNINQPKLWNFFNRPDSSTFANVFGFFSLFFVILSIFSFIAGTTSTFQYQKSIPIEDLTNSTNATTNNTISVTDVNTTGSSEFINETTQTPPERWVSIKHPILHTLDIVCLVFFTLEYIVRLVFAPKRLKFATSVMGVIDLAAILPDFIELIVYAVRPDMITDSSAVEIIGLFQILRVLRIFRLIKHVPGLWILVYTLKASVGELILLTCFMIVGILLYSSLIYFVEERSNIKSIPHAFWWALITMTTVGYGDMYPLTTLGKLVGSLCAMSGLLMIGFSVPALVNNFMLFYKHLQFALQAEKEKQHNAKKSKAIKFGENFITSTSSDNACKNTLTDNNDNTHDVVTMVTVQLEGTEGENV